MITRKVDLLENEEIIFEAGSAILTNQRLLANWEAGDGGRARDEALLKDIAPFKKFTGGQQSRIKPGFQLMAAGAVVTALDFMPLNLGDKIESLVFVVGALGAIIGLYLVLGSLFVAKPHTTILFPVPGVRDDIVVTFPGWDNPDAEELTRRFLRAKRGL